MGLTFLTSKPDKLRFATLTSIFSFVLGIIAYLTPITSEHFYFFISAPLATFIASYFAWHITFKTNEDYRTGNVVAIGILLTVASHYLNFVLLGLGRFIAYHITGNSTYVGASDSLASILIYISFFQTIISLYYFGIITIALFIFSGLIVMRTSGKEKTDPE